MEGTAREDLLTPKQYAHGIGVTMATVRNWVKKEDLKKVMIGKRIFIPKWQLDNKTRGNQRGSS